MNVAIVGCGQLAQLMALAGKNLGLTFTFLANVDEDSRCVAELGEVVIYNEEHSAQELFEALGSPHVLTVEREQVDVELLASLNAFCDVHPNPKAIAITQHRIKEKRYLHQNEFPVAPFSVIYQKEDLNLAVEKLQLPIFLKHPSMGYDGKNQWRIESAKQAKSISFDVDAYPLMAEAKIDFEFEASLVGVRSTSGEKKFYPMTKNHHKDGILISSYAGSDLESDKRFELAHKYMNDLLDAWDYCGILTIEFFVTKTGILINELAPRVHNSGHWTSDGTDCSQFENHLRAITGKELGDTSLTVYSSMVNLLGIDQIPNELADEGKVYWYNKTLKPKRKMGHINITDTNKDTVALKQDKAVNELYFKT